MDYLIICVTAVLVSGVTLFSGFGLGTVLMPAFALFFPVPVAIAATAIVHLANNLFKLALVGRSADWPIALKFSLPAVIAAIVGASLLNSFAALPAIVSYTMGGRTHEITAIGVVIGLLI
ncbi:MAG: TSUP family transporter, partial [Methylocella sp.]